MAVRDRAAIGGVPSSRMRVFLLAIAVAALGVAPAALAAPTIVLQPTSSSPGRLVTVSGRGFCSVAGCSGVTIQIYGAPVARAVPVSAEGRFVRRVRVPGGPDAGEIGVVAIQHLANGRDATAIALLTIVLRTQPPPTNLGTTVTITTAPPTTTEAPSPQTTTPPITRPPTTEPPTSAPPVTPSPPDTTGTSASTATVAGPGTSAENDGRGPWLWLAVLAAVALLVAAAGWAVSRARPRR